MKSFASYRLLLIAVLVAVVSCAWLPWLNESADTHTRQGLKRSLTTFAAARALGAALSVVQGTELSIEPIGIGVTMTPGQMLRPINELVDKFAGMMLFASVAFGVQLLLLQFGGHVAVAAALTVVMLVWATLRWRGTGGAAMRWLQPALVILLMARFAVPLTSLVSEGAYHAFMKPGYETAYLTIEGSAKAVPGATSELPESKGGIFERFRTLKNKVSELRESYRALGEAAKLWTDRIVDLIAIFVVQTVLVPLGFLWLCWRLARTLTSPGTARTYAATRSTFAGSA
ncbi:hypothetical protein ACSFA0_19615 [Variovorax sp. LT1P1]|uniref:hypothetical protein n=1 Tax=Variovorax sp. LT1P1 TaxID=3443730 RepID=UPI003F485878